MTGQWSSLQETPPKQETRQPLLLWHMHLRAAMYSCYCSCKLADLVNVVERTALCLSILALLPEAARQNRSLRRKALAREAKHAAKHAKHLAEQAKPEPCPETVFFKASASSDFRRERDGAPRGAHGAQGGHMGSTWVNSPEQGLPVLHAQTKPHTPYKSEGASLPRRVPGRREPPSLSASHWETPGLSPETAGSLSASHWKTPGSSPEPASLVRGVAGRSGGLSSGEEEPMGKKKILTSAQPHEAGGAAGKSVTRVSPGTPSKDTTGTVQASCADRKRQTMPQKRKEGPNGGNGVARKMAPRREYHEVCGGSSAGFGGACAAGAC